MHVCMRRSAGCGQTESEHPSRNFPHVDIDSWYHPISTIYDMQNCVGMNRLPSVHFMMKSWKWEKNYDLHLCFFISGRDSQLCYNIGALDERVLSECCE